jgi:hypothetical protein
MAKVRGCRKQLMMQRNYVQARRTVNPQVPGSSPGRGAKILCRLNRLLKRIGERLEIGSISMRAWVYFADATMGCSFGRTVSGTSSFK